jgi:hypothetical protein
MEFDALFETFVGARDRAWELDRIELGLGPAEHLFFGDD